MRCVLQSRIFYYNPPRATGSIIEQGADGTVKSSGISYRIERSKKGPPTIVVNLGDKEIPLHSRVDPEREALSCTNRFDPSKQDLLIVLGVGLGYHLAPLKERINEYQRVILVDILHGLEELIHDSPAAFLAGSPRVEMLFGKTGRELEEAFSASISLDGIRGVAVFEHPTSLRVFNDYYNEARRAIEAIIAKKAADHVTKKAFGYLFLRNAIRNLAHLSESAPVSALFRPFEGHPALVTAAGPSLDTHADSLREFQNYFFIVAVDSALPALRRRGIEPDIVISIDPQPRVQEHFIGADMRRSLIVHSICSHPSVARRRGFLSIDTHPLAQLIDEAYGGSIGSVSSSSGTVAGDAIALCIACGFSAVAYTGLDFSFPAFRIYARGTAYQDRYALFFQHRLETVETLNCRYVLSSSKGCTSEGHFSRKSFVGYRNAVEGLIRWRAEMPIYGLPGPRLSVASVGELSLDEFLRRHCPQPIDKERFLSTLRGMRGLDPRPVVQALQDRQGLAETIVTISLDASADQRTRECCLRLIRSLRLS